MAANRSALVPPPGEQTPRKVDEGRHTPPRTRTPSSALCLDEDAECWDESDQREYELKKPTRAAIAGTFAVAVQRSKAECDVGQDQRHHECQSTRCQPPTVCLHSDRIISEHSAAVASFLRAMPQRLPQVRISARSRRVCEHRVRTRAIEVIS
jgi:hypothetical protein